jgi:glycosyltransferase involved in cell wall biosynthesis
MKILVLADARSSHTIKWVNSLNNRDIDIFLYTLCSFDRESFDINIKIDSLDLKDDITNNSVGDFRKFRYLKALPRVRKIIKIFKPDIIHAHYLSSYGLLGTLTGFHPIVISAWGIDIIGFPQRSIFHKTLTKFICRRADELAVTSEYMKKWLEKISSKGATTIPFGIDTKVFLPMKYASMFSSNSIVIGTIKTLREQYGIEYLISAYSLLKKKHPELAIKLLIVGSGQLKHKLIEISNSLNMAEHIHFTGYIPHKEIHKYHNMIDIFVAVSIMDEETFGVAVLEASACEKPVVVSSVGGLPEIIIDNQTGIIVPPKNPEKTCEAIEKLIFNPNLRATLGKSGRERVKKLYEWDYCVDNMIAIYKKHQLSR